jgi:hypothetical protein
MYNQHGREEQAMVHRSGMGKQAGSTRGASSDHEDDADGVGRTGVFVT